MHTFYEYFNENTRATQGWHEYPNGTLDYMGRVESGYAARMAQAYRSVCKPARAVQGQPTKAGGDNAGNTTCDNCV